MERVIVTVKRENETTVRDLDLPADVDAGQLAQLVASALKWETDRAGNPVQYGIEARPLGRALRASESLSDAGVWDGSWLVLKPLAGRRGVTSAPPVDAVPPPPRDSRPEPGTGSPVTGWHSLDLPAPQTRNGIEEEEPDHGEEPPTGPFVWKQLD